MTTVLQLDDVSRLHGEGANPVHALRGVSLEVATGEFVAVMGPSGSGKSTLLNVAGGLDSASAGQVTVEGLALGGLSKAALAKVRRRSVGYVFQQLNLLPALTAAENVSLPRELDGISSRAARAEALAALQEVDLDGVADRYPDELSGGQQQRIAIARALVGPRRLLLADEPTGALDSVTGDDVIALLRSRCDTGAAVVLVTHDARLAGASDRVIFIRDGLIVDDTGVRPSVASMITGDSDR